jgi:hypothetical protein
MPAVYSKNNPTFWARLFPSTVINPNIAATFQLLNSFQMLLFTSKVSAYKFYQALARRMDNTGTSTQPVRFHVWCLSSSQCGNIVLKIITMVFNKWFVSGGISGCSRDWDKAITGHKGMNEEGCAVLCPACPLPGINLVDWKERPSTEQ